LLTVNLNETKWIVGLRFAARINPAAKPAMAMQAPFLLVNQVIIPLPLG
jgi:hypothetical protein